MKSYTYRFKDKAGTVLLVYDFERRQFATAGKIGKSGLSSQFQPCLGQADALEKLAAFIRQHYRGSAEVILEQIQTKIDALKQGDLFAGGNTQ